jgi:CheY-like chemotaxis protein
MIAFPHPRASVLIVDDDPIEGGLLNHVLRTGGYDVQLASSGSSGLLALCSGQSAIGWLVTKVVLPSLIDGRMLADEYNRHHENRPPVFLADPSTLPAQPSNASIMLPTGAPMQVLEVLHGLTGIPHHRETASVSRAA